MNDVTSPPTDAVSIVSDLVDEFTERVNHGEHPDIDEYVKRHPELATMIRQVLGTLEMIRQIKDQPGMRRLPVIAISALGFSEVVRQAMAAGATDFILKPVDPAVLTDKVRRALATDDAHGVTARPVHCREPSANPSKS
jgi:CheY-like chemotaxis protein